jgi:hypothetical protein
MEIEPFVTFLALLAGLFGLNYINHKIERPELRFKLSRSVAALPNRDMITGVSIELQNHSIFKCHIKSFYFTVPSKKQIFQILGDGFSGKYLQNIELEPGQSFSFNITKNQISKFKGKITDLIDLVAEDEIERKFVASRKDVRDILISLEKI